MAAKIFKVCAFSSAACDAAFSFANRSDQDFISFFGGAGCGCGGVAVISSLNWGDIGFSSFLLVGTGTFLVTGRSFARVPANDTAAGLCKENITHQCRANIILTFFFGRCCCLDIQLKMWMLLYFFLHRSNERINTLPLNFYPTYLSRSFSTQWCVVYFQRNSKFLDSNHLY